MDGDTGVAAFVAARGPGLLRLAVLLTADADAAQDVVQDALAKVIPRWSRIVASGDPEPYVRAAVRSAWIDSWRRRRLEVVAEPPDSASPDHGSPSAVRLSVDAALARLTPRQRTVLVLRFYEDLTEAQTARAMHCSVSTVKSQSRHALARLKVLAPDLALLVGARDTAEVV